MSPRGRPASMPHALSASGPISVTPRSSHPTDSSHSERARSASGLMCTREPPPSGCLRQISSNGARRIVADTCPAGRPVGDACARTPRVSSPSRRLRTCPLPVVPTRVNVDGRRLPAAATTRRTRVHDPARDRLDHHPRRPTRNGAADAHVRPPGVDSGRSQRRLSPGLPGPAVPVPQHRPRTHRTGRRAHHGTRSASTNSPGAPPGRPPAPSTARPRPSTACARLLSTGAGSTPCPASPTACARIRPAKASSNTPNTSPSAPTCRVPTSVTTSSASCASTCRDHGGAAHDRRPQRFRLDSA